MPRKILDVQEFLNRTIFRVLPDINNAESMDNTTPSVSNLNVLVFVNTAPVTITNFLRGAFFQTIRLVGDGFTTVDHNATIKTNTAAPKLLSADKIYVFTNVDEVWIEDAS